MELFIPWEREFVNRKLRFLAIIYKLLQKTAVLSDGDADQGQNCGLVLHGSLHGNACLFESLGKSSPVQVVVAGPGRGQLFLLLVPTTLEVSTEEGVKNLAVLLMGRRISVEDGVQLCTEGWKVVKEVFIGYSSQGDPFFQLVGDEDGSS